MAKMGVSAAAGPIMAAWAEQGFDEFPEVGFRAILDALVEANHSTAGFGQVVAAFMSVRSNLTADDIVGIIRDVAFDFDAREAK